MDSPQSPTTDSASFKRRPKATPEQLEALEDTYKKSLSVRGKNRKTLAEKLGMTERSVQIWFQNRRAKDKHEARKRLHKVMIKKQKQLRAQMSYLYDPAFDSMPVLSPTSGFMDQMVPSPTSATLPQIETGFGGRTQRTMSMFSIDSACSFMGSPNTPDFLGYPTSPDMAFMSAPLSPDFNSHSFISTPMSPDFNPQTFMSASFSSDLGSLPSIMEPTSAESFCTDIPYQLPELSCTSDEYSQQLTSCEDELLKKMINDVLNI